MASDYEKQKIGKRLQSLLDEKSLSQSTVGGWFGLKQSAISAWCRGTSEFTITQGLELARRFGVSLDWLSGLSEERGKAPTSKEVAVLRLAKLIETVGVEEAARRIEESQQTIQPDREREKVMRQYMAYHEEVMRRIKNGEPPPPLPQVQAEGGGTAKKRKAQ